MKTLLILILAAALAGGAFLSRPTEADFKQMIHRTLDSGEKPQDLVKLIFGGSKSEADRMLDSCKFHNNLLWTSVEKDGKTIYVGAFSTWFKWPQKETSQAPAQQS